jgi:branched-chain amino acid transport system ATP-binding protein
VTAAPLLRVNNLEVVYHHAIQVLKGLSLSVPEGAVVALLGSNGAGKTTTLKAISGLLPLEDGEIVDGEISFRGASIAGRLPHQIARGGLFQVMEGRRIFEHLTVEENLECASYARRGAMDLGEDFRKVYGYFPRLRERRRQLGGYLSGGEQQMLAIGRALVARPALLLLDEPSLGLSPLLVQEIFRIIQLINRAEKVSILLVEQNAHMALSIAQHAYVLENGKVVLDGPAERVRQDRDVQEFYLGRHGGAQASYREVKHYKRRKRWLS